MLAKLDNLTRIPLELRQLNQWVCWRLEQRNGKPTKVPINPKSGTLANVTNAATWSSFDEAVASINDRRGYAGIGFVFTDNDCYCGIDLDADADAAITSAQVKIFEAMDSYSERSPSGNGCHIIVKAKVAQGRRKHCVEVYSQDRFFTFTGDVVKDRPIRDAQAEVDILIAEMGEPNGAVEDSQSQEQSTSDDDVYNRARDARNGDRFVRLFSGEWAGEINSRTNLPYASQSEADQALINDLCFFSQNYEQVARIFRASALGQRDKAKRENYVRPMFNKGMDMQPRDVDLAEAMASVNRYVNGQKHTPADNRLITATASYNYSKPPGLLGEIADFIYRASPRPIESAALAGAIACLSGICGSAFNVSGTGLNQYVLFLAKTGVGKDGMRSGINRIFKIISADKPAFNDFIGPEYISSGQGLIKDLKRSSSFVAILGEFGHTLRNMTSPRASSSEVTLMRNLLALYGSSGFGQTTGRMVYSDVAKNVEAISRPAVTLLAEGTPETIFGALDETQVANGLIPRFMVIEHEGDRPPTNKAHTQAQLPAHVAADLSRLAMVALDAQKRDFVVNVQATGEAQEALDAFDVYCDDKLRGQSQDARRDLWNRAHFKVMRLAALVAVGCNDMAPVIQLEHVVWARDLVLYGTEMLVARFASGEIGEALTAATPEQNQLRDVAQCIVKIATHEINPKAYDADEDFFARHYVERTTLSRMVRARASFRKARNQNFSQALDNAVKALCDMGYVYELTRKQLDDLAKEMKKDIRNARLLFVMSGPALDALRAL